MRPTWFHLGVALLLLGFAGFALPSNVGEPLALGIFTAAGASFLAHIIHTGEVPLRGTAPYPTFRTKPVAFVLGLLLYVFLFLAFFLSFLYRLLEAVIN